MTKDSVLETLWRSEDRFISGEELGAVPLHQPGRRLEGH